MAQGIVQSKAARCLRLACLLLLAAPEAARAEPDGLPLLPGVPRSGQLWASASRRHLLRLSADQCALGSLGLRVGAAAVLVYGTGTVPLRRFAGVAAEPFDWEFCADADGDYTLEVQSLNTRERYTSYRLLLETLLRRRQGSSTRARVPDSPRLLELQRALGSDPNALDAFWKERATQGGPLVESSDDALLVSFVFRGSDATKRVRVHWRSWTGELADAELTPLSGSDVWWRSVHLPRAARLSYQLVPDPPDPAGKSRFAERAFRAVAIPDPLNRQRMRMGADSDASSQHSLLTLPGAEPERWLAALPEAQTGKLETTRFRSRRLQNERSLTVYVPAAVSGKTGPYPLLVFFDGESYLNELAAPTLLDNLIAAGKIPALFAAFVTNTIPNTRSRELPCNPRFADALALELLPWLRAHYPISQDPRQVGLAGSSFGGLAAAFAAHRHPEHFGLVLSQSGSFWFPMPAEPGQLDRSAGPGGLIRGYDRAAPALPIRFYLSAGTLENGAVWSILGSNRKLRAALELRGYTISYTEFVGGHDALAWRADLPTGLLALFGKQPETAAPAASGH